MRFFKILFFCLLSLQVFSQSKKQRELENKKKALLEQIKQMSALRNKQANQRKTASYQIQEINEKIEARTELIRVSNEQANLLNQEIIDNQQQIRILQKDLSNLRQEYAAIIRQSYKTRAPKNQLLFLLSSQTFSQGYKRLKYIEQYTAHRKNQTKKIREKNEKLEKINEELKKQRREKERVLLESETAKSQLAKERQQQEFLIELIRKKEKEYEIQIKKKQEQANAIDKEIDRLVRLAIIEANKKAKESKKKLVQKPKTDRNTPEAKNITIELTDDTKSISDNFQASKGKLIWPVARGYKSQGFGTYSDPVYPDVKHNNSGVTIATSENAQVRAIFQGEVSAIIAVPGGNKAVQIRHGDFISIYYNLSEVFVSKGQQVSEKTPLGKIFTDAEGKTEMKFFLYKNTTKLNPEYWIHKM